MVTVLVLLLFSLLMVDRAPGLLGGLPGVAS